MVYNTIVIYTQLYGEKMSQKTKQRLCPNCSGPISRSASLCRPCKFKLQTQKAVEGTIGKKFNRLTCIKFISSGKNRQLYEWKCDCGAIKQYLRAHVVDGGIKSCGCLKSERQGKNRDFSGLERFNYKVIKKLDKIKDYRHLYKCLCKCGNYFELSEKMILRKDANATKSCGCLREIRKYKNTIPLSYIKRLKVGAISRNIEYNISLEDIYQCFIKQNGKCALTGADLYFTVYALPKQKRTNASLDRINNSIGYIPGNIQWLDKDINRLKNNYTTEELINFARRIVEWQTQTTHT
jgi:hypothetical protein